MKIKRNKREAKKRLIKKAGFVLTMDALFFIMIFGMVSVQFLKYQSKQQLDASINATGEKLAQINNGIRSYVSFNALGPAPATQTGIDWLKSPSCGGLPTNPVEGYIPCSFTDKTHFGQTMTTTFVKVATLLTATTDVTGLAQSTPDIRDAGRIANAIALRAMSTPGYTQNALGFSFYEGNPGVNLAAPNPSAQPDYGVIRMIASNAANTDNWIRTDGSNSPQATINWNNQSITDLDQLDSVTQNNSGEITTDTLVSNSGITNTGLLTNNGDVSVTGNAAISGGLVAGGKITANELEISGAILTSGDDVAIGDKLIAGDVLATDLTISGGAYLTKAVYDVRLVPAGALVAKPLCPSGTSPYIFTASSSFHYGNPARPVYGVKTYASNSGLNWNVGLSVLLDSGVWQSTPVNASDYMILVVIKCT